MDSLFKGCCSPFEYSAKNSRHKFTGSNHNKRKISCRGIEVVINRASGCKGLVSTCHLNLMQKNGKSQNTGQHFLISTRLMC